MNQKRKVNPFILNVLFVAICAAIMVFLLNAPKETTSPLPHDATHEHLFSIKDKQEAETFCLNCHGEGKEAPLSADHPPKYRCLFCHKRL